MSVLVVFNAFVQLSDEGRGDVRGKEERLGSRIRVEGGVAVLPGEDFPISLLKHLFI